jgi:flagellar assembly protein FliH
MSNESGVTNYTFQSLFRKKTKEGIENFEFSKLDVNNFKTDNDEISNEEMLRVERRHESETGFSIAPIVREHRGINRQEQDERERTIEGEVEKRLRKLEEEAFHKGHAEGIKIGKEEIYGQMRSECETKLESISEMVSAVLKTQIELIQSEKVAVQKTIRNLTKWIILRELKGDEQYLERLLAKLIEELQTKSNLLIQVNPKAFSSMPDILETVQKSLGKLDQVRVEEDFDIAGPGIVINSENGIINGTLREQFRSLDELFSKVGVEAGDQNYDELFETLTINENVDEDLNESESEILVTSEQATDLVSENIIETEDEAVIKSDDDEEKDSE